MSKEELFSLYQYLVSTHKIICSDCKKSDTISIEDEHIAVDYFYEQGWRSKDDKCYCPKCEGKLPLPKDFVKIKSIKYK